MFFQEAMQKLVHTDANYSAKQKAKELIMATHSEKYYEKPLPFRQWYERMARLAAEKKR